MRGSREGKENQWLARFHRVQMRHTTSQSKGVDPVVVCERMHAPFAEGLVGLYAASLSLHDI